MVEARRHLYNVESPVGHAKGVGRKQKEEIVIICVRLGRTGLKKNSPADRQEPKWTVCARQ